MLGTDVGTAHHPMNLSVDLPDLMESLDHHEVYVYKKGRYLDKNDTPVTDIISAGLTDLLNGKTSPLNEYNTAFRRLQARRRLVPLVNKEDTTSSVSVDITVPNGTSLCATVQSDTIQQLDEGGWGSDDGDSEEDSDDEDGKVTDKDPDSENEDEEDLRVDDDDEIDDEDIGDFLRSFEDTSG
ncbi:hypothetical protein BDZ97DRAFT_1933630 [Flammula alnicola]|nr:hypothetical protein BDZ97DRAFT_1933630 [Flammula alnicola]